jgi:hypothetical protein
MRLAVFTYPSPCSDSSEPNLSMDSTTASTSASSGPPHVVVDEIQKLFKWNPPLLYSAPAGQAQAGKISQTRGPSFYDKHFRDDMVLKRVKRFPDLTTQLAENVDKSLAGEAAMKLSDLDGFVTDKQRKENNVQMSKSMKDEKDIANYYDKTTANYCSRVASTLAFRQSRWMGTLLNWTQSPRKADYAIPDGQLCLMNVEKDDPDEQVREDSMKTLDPNTREILDKMREDMSTLATWEFKSLTVGHVDVMTAVSNLGTFPWTYCKAPDYLKNKEYVEARKKVAMVIIGCDALDPPWKLPVSLHSLNRKVAHHTTGKFFRYKRNRPIS